MENLQKKKGTHILKRYKDITCVFKGMKKGIDQ